MPKFIAKFLFVSLNIIITGIGASMSLKAGVGVGAWDAFSQSASLVLGMKVGTFAMMLNTSCVIGQLILLGKAFKPQRFLQVFVAVLLGVVVNFMLYNVFAQITIDNYFLNLGLFLVSMLVLVFGVANIMVIDFITLPLESLCLVVSDKTKKNFGAVRQAVDVISIVIALSLAFAFGDMITVREGTVIGMLIFGPLLHKTMPLVKPFIQSLGLMD